MPKVKDIPFCRIPNQSALFLDYLSLSRTALRYYQQAPTLKNLRNQRLEPAAFPRPSRSEIATLLRRQNESYGCDSATMHQIEVLEKPDSIAILTGQQVGLFGGPLYTIYKAVTAIRIAEELRKNGSPAAAIFWMEGEDHDLAEVTRCTIFHPRAGLKSIDYRNVLFKGADATPRSVGHLRFPDKIREAVSDYLGSISDSKWKPEVQYLLESAYRPGATFAQAFARLLGRIFHGTGLIFYDPQAPQAKRLTANIVRKALQDAPAIHAALVERDRELQAAGFHSQVKIPENSTVLFFMVDGERRALERRNSGFGVKNRDCVSDLKKCLRPRSRIPRDSAPMFCCAR